MAADIDMQSTLAEGTLMHGHAGDRRCCGCIGCLTVT
jgi:hypothetical protein